jgi:DNA-binding ferritin-like protein (Dps family)
MSVEPTDAIQEETIPEETQERTQEELEAINPNATAMFAKLLSGEDEPEEEVKEEVEEDKTEEPVVEETTTDVEETTEESDEWSIPQEALEKYPWMAHEDLDYTDPKVVDAVNFMADGPRPEWMPDSNRVSDMDEDYARAYKSVQSAMSKTANQRQQEQQPQGDPMALLREAYKMHAELKKQDTITPQPVKEEVQDNRLKELNEELIEAMQNSEDAKVAEITERIVEVKTDQKLKSLNIEQKVEELVQAKLTQVQQNQFDRTVMAEDAELTQTYGDRYLQYVSNGYMKYVIEEARDTLTGEKIISLSSPTPVHDAFNYILSQKNGGQTIARPRPASEAQPPAGSTEGEVTGVTEELMNKSWEDFVKDPRVKKELSNI